MNIIKAMLATVLCIVSGGCFQPRHDSEPPELYIKEIRQGTHEGYYEAYRDYILVPINDPLKLKQEDLILYYKKKNLTTEQLYKKGVIFHENFHAWNMRRDWFVRMFGFIPYVRKSYDWQNEQEAYKYGFDYLFVNGGRWSEKTAMSYAKDLSGDMYGNMIDYYTALLFMREILRVNKAGVSKPGVVRAHDIFAEKMPKIK